MRETVALNGADTDDTPCARCKASNATLTVRSERQCKDCFVKYVGSKLVKQLERNKSRGGYRENQKTLLVPVAFDVSSICLLHALDEQLRKRLESGRHASYTLHILCIDDSRVIQGPSIGEVFPLLKQSFPDYPYSIISLEDCFSYGIELEPFVPKPDGTGSDKETDSTSRLQHILACLPSATSRADIIKIVRRKLIAASAKRNGCDSILFSDSTTKLAERTLAETAKGRGGGLPWLISDNVIVDDVPCTYPLRELLQKELALYVNVAFPSLKSLVMSPENVKPVASSKDMTIDGLMTQYFESVEENFPSIVANVVRTTGKLAPCPELDYGQICDLCQLPLPNVERNEELGGPKHTTQLTVAETQNAQLLCSGCARTLDGA